MKEPIKWISHDSTESNSPETRLLSDEWELQESHKQYSSSQVAHSRKSLSLTLVIIMITVQPLPSIRCFLI